MSKAFDDLTLGPKPANYIPNDYEKNIHRIFHQTVAGKDILEGWKRDLVARSPIKLNDPHDLMDMGIVVGYAQHKREIIAIVERINNGGQK